MPKMSYKTKDNACPEGKRRVYFTCHPEDFDLYFERLCRDIFQTHDCVIYYTEDLVSPFEESEKELDLGSSNLFLVPVTSRLLCQPNRAMEEDIPYAKRSGIPILPFMMEAGLDRLYAEPKNFGDLQYLQPESSDLTQINYGEKLKKYLESVLISDELANRIRAAFDAYVFLSYRKKDRKYANELMRLIHSDPQYRSIAIWYDEFLTPGESFQKNIDMILANSKLFALLVTPNLLEEPNYVMSNEYPAAKKAGMEILPAEMVQTDRGALLAKYNAVPDCADPHDSAFFARLSETLGRFAKKESVDDPVHNYLMGLAYLDGIDVEVDRAYGTKLVTLAAEAGLPEAMERLYTVYLYEEYYNVPSDADVKLGKAGENNSFFHSLYQAFSWEERIKATRQWMEKIYSCYMEKYGELDERTLDAMHRLAREKAKTGEYRQAQAMYQRAYELRCGLLGQKHRQTLASLAGYGYTSSWLEEHAKSHALYGQAYTLQAEVLGPEHVDTLKSLGWYAYETAQLGEHAKAAELYETAYALHKKVLGSLHTDTLHMLDCLACQCGLAGNVPRALELLEELFVLRCQDNSRETEVMNHVRKYAERASLIGAHQKAGEMYETLFDMYKNAFGEGNRSITQATVKWLQKAIAEYEKLEDYPKIVRLREQICETMSKAYGEQEVQMLGALHDLAYACSQAGDHQRSLALYEKVCCVRGEILGESSANAAVSLYNLANEYSILGQHKKALEHFRKAFLMFDRVMGEEHPHTKAAMQQIANELRFVPED